MKSYRQAAILEIVESDSITSQEQLRERLRARGIEATQATLSRDIRDLSLIKQASDGAYRRGLTAPEPSAAPDELMQTAVEDYLMRHEAVEQLLVLRTEAGLAQPLAVALDRARAPEIVGTIAGDDTVLVICRSTAAASTLAARFDTIMKQ